MHLQTRLAGLVDELGHNLLPNSRINPMRSGRIIPCTRRAYLSAIANGAMQQIGWPTTWATPYVRTITENEER